MPIEISKMIVHNLNLRGGNAILRDECINLDSLEDADIALEFFKKHINSTRTFGFTKKCCFVGSPANLIQNSVIRVIENYNDAIALNEVFIEESKRITQHLRNVMSSTSSTSDGSLFVLFYSIDGENYIGLLKMDPNTGIEVTENLEIIVRADMLPTPKQRLHKSAFIKLLDNYEDNQIHLFALDRQQNTDEAAKFFMKDYLNVRELADEKNLTANVQKEILAEFSEIVPINQVPLFNHGLKNLLNTGEEFNIDENLMPVLRRYVPDLPDADFENAVQKVKDNILVKYPDATFSFEPDSSKINPTVYKSRDKLVEIRISKEITPGAYTTEIDPQTEELLFRFPQELGIKLEK